MVIGVEVMYEVGHAELVSRVVALRLAGDGVVLVLGAVRE